MPQKPYIKLKDLHGIWQDDQNTLQQMATSFYKSLYTTKSNLSSRPECWNFPLLDRADKSWLNRSMSDKEIRNAMFQMGADKAPDPDGFPPGFY